MISMHVSFDQSSSLVVQTSYIIELNYGIEANIYNMIIRPIYYVLEICFIVVFTMYVQKIGIQCYYIILHAKEY